MAAQEHLGVDDLRACILAFRDALVAHREAINSLNVYPVPDGDTGTNMSLTMRSVAEELATSADDLDATCKAISHGSLMGARGNSGVILSQILRGFSDVVARSGHDRVGPELLARALTVAAEAAYGAVMKPVEGTILTVAREIAEECEAAAADGASLLELLERAKFRGEESLERTPELLAVLADAGVVDAGGAGFLLFVDAMLHVVDGRPLPDAPEPVELEAVRTSVPEEGGTSIADLRYEVMYFLEAPDDAVAGFKEAWATMGDSIVVVGGDGVWNCHIHTDDIGGSIEAGIGVGRPYEIRVTDLLDQVGHLESITEPESVAMVAGEPVATAVVAVGVGAGVRGIFESLGVRAVVTGGQTMNPSTEILLQATEQVPADQVILLPNNKNIIPVAEQVDALTDKTVVVVPTRGIAEGFASLIAYDPQATAADNVAAMAEAARSVVAGEVTRAVRPAQSEVGPVSEGDWIGLSRDGIRAVAPSIVEAAVGLLADLVTSDHDLVTLIEGIDADRADTAAIVEWLHTSRPDVEVEVHAGGQPLYPYYVGVE